MEKLKITSLRKILQFGFNIKYSTLKNYYSERRCLPKNFFDDLCEIANVKKSELKRFKIKYLKENWGQVKGGNKRKKN